MDTSQCANNYKPDADTSNAGQMAKTLMTRLAAANQDCNTTNVAMATAGEFNGPLGMAGGKVASSLNVSKVSGCQALQSVVANYLNSVYTSRCLINNDQNSSGVIVSNIASFTANAYDGGQVLQGDCPGGVILKQAASTVLKSFSNLSVETKTAIADVVKQNIGTTIAQIQKITSAAGGTPEGSANLTTLQQKVQDEDMLTQLNNSGSKVQTNITQMATGMFNAYGPGSVTYMPCVINQSAILDMQLATIISEAYASTMSGEIAQVMTSAISQKSTIKNLAPPSALDMFNSSWGMIAGIIGAIILAIIVVMLIKSGALKKMMSKSSKSSKSEGGISGMPDIPKFKFY